MASIELLRQVAQLVKTGNLMQARGVLWRSLEQDPSDERAWLYYSELAETIEEKADALQRAITLNPKNDRAQARLRELHEQLRQQQQILEQQRARQAQQLFQSALQAYQSKKSEEALHLLLQLVEQDERNEAAWLMLSDVVPAVADQVIALENALTLNPENPKARQRLKKLQTLAQDPLNLGAYYEQRGDLDQAIATYLDVEKNGKTPAIRAEATRRMAVARFRHDRPNYRLVSPLFTLTRLTLGPVILYVVLVMVQSGLNPMHTPLHLCLSGPLVVLGSLLLVIYRDAPSRSMWLKFFGGSDGRGNFFSAVGLPWLALVILLIPFILLFYDSWIRYHNSFTPF